MMSLMLRLVPMKKPANPMHPISEFLIIIKAFAMPLRLFQWAIVSNRAGNKMPNVESANAPTNEIKMSKFGIATAQITAIKKRKK